MKPRIFISTVSTEFTTVRQLVANILTRLGYEPVWHEIFGAESGDLRQMLRKQIDSCDGLVQIVGHGYGAEPPPGLIDPAFGRVSYTQFEFLYARQQNKKTWLIYAGDGCTRDTTLEKLDLPRDPNHPHPSAYQTERRDLQTGWRTRWKGLGETPETHLRYTAANDDQLAYHVERLKDEFAKLRRGFRRWQLAVVALLVCLLVGLGWIAFRQDKMVSQIVDLQPESIKATLWSTIEETYQRDLSRAEAMSDWQKRHEAKQGAKETRDRRLGQVHEFLESITREYESGQASPEFNELTRILQEQGVDEALKYVASQESRLLSATKRLTKEKRRTLAPLLEAVRLHRAKGELNAAVARCEKLLVQDGDWPELLREHIQIRIELGDEAQKFTTVADSLAEYEAAEVSARRALAAQPDDSVRQSDYSVCLCRLGDVYLKLGRTNKALMQFQEGLRISLNLAEADDNDAQKQRHLSVLFNRLGDIYLTLGCTDEALEQFQASEKIRRVLAEADPNDALKQRDLSISFGRLGNVYLTLGRTDDALKQYQANEAISRVLAAADPNDAAKQRDLSVVFGKLGEVYVMLDRGEDALIQFQASEKISRALAEADPNDAVKQRDLFASCEKVGEVLLMIGRPHEALAQFQDGLKISRALVSADPSNAQKQLDLSIALMKLGDVYLTLGRTDDARTQFEVCKTLCRVLVEADPSNAQKQRILSLCVERLGDVYLTLGRTDDALKEFQASEKIRRVLAEADPNNAEKQRDLLLRLDGLGDVYLRLGRANEAVTQFQDALKISRVLAEADPSDSRKQRDLSISLERLGYVYLNLGLADDAFTQIQASHEIRCVLAEADPNNAQKQRDLWRSHNQLAHAWIQAKQESKAIAQLRQGLEIGDRELINNPQFFSPYSFACHSSMKVLLHTLEIPQPSEEETKVRQELRTDAIKSLKAVIDGGFHDFAQLRQDPDFTPLHGLPEFEALFPNEENE